MKVIGFANKFYTLWEKYQDSKVIYMGNQTQTYKIWKADYIKNISTDINVVKSMYPDVEIDLNLRGTHFEWDKKPIIPAINIKEYQFGKLKGTEITENDNLGYLEWYYNSISSKCEHKDYVWSVLEKCYANNGYMELNGNWYTPADYEKAVHRVEIRKAFFEKAKVGEPLEVVFTRNFSHGEDENDVFFAQNWIDGDTFNDVTFILTEGNYVERFYDGYHYYLPQVKGKGKLIKNKNMVITDYDFQERGGRYDIVINKFEIKK